MKKILTIAALSFLLASCAAPKAGIKSINYTNGSLVVMVDVLITTPTNEQADSLLQVYTKKIVSYSHISDSANVHYYTVTLTSPPLQIKGK